MRKISNTGIELCKYQADFFEASVNYLDCSSSFFYKQFSNSNLAKRMDPQYIFSYITISLIYISEALNNSAYLLE